MPRRQAKQMSIGHLQRAVGRTQKEWESRYPRFFAATQELSRECSLETTRAFNLRTRDSYPLRLSSHDMTFLTTFGSTRRMSLLPLPLFAAFTRQRRSWAAGATRVTPRAQETAVPQARPRRSRCVSLVFSLRLRSRVSALCPRHCVPFLQRIRKLVSRKEPRCASNAKRGSEESSGRSYRCSSRRGRVG